VVGVVLGVLDVHPFGGMIGLVRGTGTIMLAFILKDD